MKLYYLLFLLIISLSCKKKDLFSGNTDTNQYYDKAYRLLTTDKDSSFVYFNLAKDQFLRKGDSLRAGNCLVNMAIISTDYGDYFGGIETSLSALPLLGEKNKNIYPVIKSNYNNLGISSYNLKQYKNALNFYSKALQFAEDSLSIKIYLNNKANAYRELKQYDSALYIYNKIIKNIGIKDKKEYARFITNYAKTRWLKNPNYNPIPEFQKALNLRYEENDLWGQNSSFAHLADYYIHQQADSALVYAEKMYSVAKQLKSSDDETEALQKLIRLDPQHYQNYFSRYESLTDSLKTIRDRAKNQFALIRYDTEKEKAENARKQNYILKQNIAIGLLIISLIGGFIWYKRRQKRLRQETEIKVKNTQLKYSRKVHDVVANGLYHTMVEIQNNPEFNKENTLNRIEKMYEESRDIARDDFMELAGKDFSTRLSKMLNSYYSDNQKVLVVGNDSEKWENVSPQTQSEIYYTLREAMVNTVKHSKAKLTSIKVEKSENILTIKYTDNGIGIEDLEKISTSGIRNMENRIEGIGGAIIFDKNPKGGLVIIISVPIQ